MDIVKEIVVKDIEIPMEKWNKAKSNNELIELAKSYLTENDRSGVYSISIVDFNGLRRSTGVFFELKRYR